jgi:hypothetical protein
MRFDWAARLSSSLVGVAALAACFHEPPVYDEDIHMQAISTEQGSLAGTWAQKAVAATLVKVPIPGVEDTLGGGYHLLLLHRVFDEKTQQYHQDSKVCGGMNFRVHDTFGDSLQPTYRSVPAFDNEHVVVDHDKGTFHTLDHLQLWGLQGLDDPQNAPLPKSKDEANAAPFASHLFDMESDGKPGFTTVIRGVTEGEAYSIMRKKAEFQGLVVEADRVVGLAKTSYENTLLGATNLFIEALMGGSAGPYPDPKESWFVEKRIADDATCDDVTAMDNTDDGLPQFPPFPAHKDEQPGE